MKLISMGKGLSCYDTTDHAYRVTMSKGRSWSGDRGSFTYTEWTAFSVTEKEEHGLPLRVARGNTLKSLKVRLERYLADKANNCLKSRNHYGL